MEGSAPWGVGDGSVSPFPSPLEEETRGRRVRGAEGALPGQVNGWWGTHLSPVMHPLAPRSHRTFLEEPYLANSSSSVSGISRFGFFRAELNFSLSFATNSLNSLAQTCRCERMRC